jgi:hypothetical protein
MVIKMKNYNLWMTTNGNEHEEIVYDMCEKSLVTVKGSIAEYECVINDANEWQKNVDVIALFKKSVYLIQIGDFITESDKTYLTIYETEDRDFYSSAKMRLCNSTLTIPGDTTKTQTGTDWRGAPVYDETSTSPTLLPCIAESKIYLSQGENQEPINLPNGRILVTIPYTDNSKVNLNFEFEMYGHKYKTTHVDRSQVINNVGILQLTADLI